MKKFILTMVAFAAFIFVVGSAGAFDNNDITLLQFLVQCAIGIGVEWVALSSLAKKEEK